MDSSPRHSFAVQLRLLCILAVACFVLSKQAPAPDVHQARERLSLPCAMQLFGEEATLNNAQGALLRGVRLEKAAQPSPSHRHASVTSSTLPLPQLAASLRLPAAAHPGLYAEGCVQILPSWRGLIFFALPPPSSQV